MKYLLIFGLFILYMYPLSYAKYTWKRKEYLPAIGTIILTTMALIFPALLLITR